MGGAAQTLANLRCLPATPQESGRHAVHPAGMSGASTIFAAGAIVPGVAVQFRVSCAAGIHDHIGDFAA
jgi:hypothetical protein